MEEFLSMGRSYLFECEKCAYRAAVAGGISEGYDLVVQTIRCRNCRALYDCVISIRSNKVSTIWKRLDEMPEDLKPNLASALNRLPPSADEPQQWMEFKPACPQDATHRVEIWKSPGRCPKCRAYMESSALPFRIWD